MSVESPCIPMRFDGLCKDIEASGRRSAEGSESVLTAPVLAPLLRCLSQNSTRSWQPWQEDPLRKYRPAEKCDRQIMR